MSGSKPSRQRPPRATGSAVCRNLYSRIRPIFYAGLGFYSGFRLIHCSVEKDDSRMHGPVILHHLSEHGDPNVSDRMGGPVTAHRVL